MLEAYAPLGSRGHPILNSSDPDVLEDPTVNEIARKHGVTSAQVSRRRYRKVIQKQGLVGKGQEASHTLKPYLKDHNKIIINEDNKGYNAATVLRCSTLSKL